MKLMEEGDMKKNPYEAQLKAHARVEAKAVLKAINDHVPGEVEGMKHSRQYVLEEVIRILKESV